MVRTKFTLIFQLLLFIPAALFAKEKLILSLEQCISIGQQKSPSAAITKHQFESAKWDYNAFRAGLFPQVSLSMVTPELNRSISPLLLDDGSTNFITRKEASSSINLSISQEVPWTGGEFSIRSGIQRIDRFGEIDTYIWGSTPLLFEFRQPLFQFNSLNWDRKLNDLQYRAAQLRYREDLEGLALEVSEYFFNFYLAKISLDNANSNYTVNDTIFNISKGRYNVGKIAENELLQSELKLMEARAQVSSAKLGYKRAEEDLRIHLKLPHDIELEVSTPKQIVPFEIDPDYAVEQARKNRSDPLNYEYQRLQAERDMDRAKSITGLTGSLRASFGYNQTTDKFSELYQDPLDQQYFNLSFQIPLLTWGKGNAQLKAEYARREAVENSVILTEQQFYKNVYFQALEVRQLQDQVLLAAKSDTIAARRFEVSKNRYLIGKIDITNMFIAQNEKDMAMREYIARQRQYWFAYYKLRQLTLFDFEKRKPLNTIH